MTDNGLSGPGGAVGVAQPSGFTLKVPDSWVEFDVWRANHTGDLARLVDARLAGTPDLKPYRGALLKMLKDVAVHAERAGAIYCAAMCEADDEAGILAASVMVLRNDGPPDPADNTVEAIASQVTSIAPSGPDAPWRQVQIVDLPAGRAVQVKGMEPAVASRPDSQIVTMLTLVPVPGGGGVVTVVLMSPQVELAEPMLDLFDAISSTFGWSEVPTPERLEPE
jgi:hypothetical protein